MHAQNTYMQIVDLAILIFRWDKDVPSDNVHIVTLELEMFDE